MYYCHGEPITGTARKVIEESNDRTAYDIVGDATEDTFIGESGSVTTSTGLRIPATQILPISENSKQDTHMAVWALTSAESAIIYIREDFAKK